MEEKTKSGSVDYNLPFDSKVQRLKKRYQGLSRVTAAINDLSIYGIFTSNYPNLTIVLEQAKDHCKEIIKETKKEIAMIEDPQSLYDLMRGEELPNVDTETAEKSEDMGPEQFRDKGF
jgi:hypothetical protein|tara:strand:- start:185 stop:538 length:354 start_codon:yes stop_codon:yes gene_type:complete